MTRSALQIRLATTSDVSIILRLIGSTYRGDESRKGWTTEADFLVGDRIDAAGVLDKLSNPDGVMLLASSATVPDTVIACCELLSRTDKSGYFGLFAVEPTHQGGGVGKEMLNIAEEYASKTMEVKSLELQVIAMRPELIAWYKRRGYTIVDERPFPYEMLVAGAKALRDDLYFKVMKKELAA
jgi:ribosomal protein S18 acetylase RimI-like enzyme